MSYSRDTPESSSDDDDYEAVANQNMGTFSENNLDASNYSVSANNQNVNVNNDNPSQNVNQMSDSDDNNQDNDVDMNLWIQIDADGVNHKYAFSQNDTLKDLRDQINARQQRTDFRMSDCHFFAINDHQNIYDDADDIENNLLIDEALPAITYNQKTLQIFWKSFTVTIVDGLDFNVSQTVAQDYTIKQLKDDVEKVHCVKLQALSYNGMELIDDEQLGHHGINKDGFTIISRISITIQDHACDISTDLLICDFWDFEKVLATYLECERREHHNNAFFSHQTHPVNLSEHVYNLRLKNRSKLEYTVEKYSVSIYDTDGFAQHHMGFGGSNSNDLNAYPLDVFDHWTLTDVKTAYSKLTKKPFMENEKFLSNERELEDNVPLWKLRIRDGEKLIIERQQHEAAVEYICCECGLAVLLRRYDSVQCRNCFHEAVYKKRTARVCQYNCR